MKKALGAFGLCAALVGFFAFTKWQQSAPDSAVRAPADDGAYCVAIRGNGEAEPAHWGALAKTVEQLGLPGKMAGGSSATISMMLMEAIAAHPLVQNQPLAVQKERASLLLKSLLGFFSSVQQTQTWADIQKFYGMFQGQKDMETLQKTWMSLEANQVKQAYAILKKGMDMGLLDPAAVQPLMQAFANSDVKRAQFYLNEMIQTAKVFGSFNAQTDDNLFFRAGLVNFTKAAGTFGKIAGFYAAQDRSAVQSENWKNFMQTCAAGSTGLSWIEIVTKNPNCAGLFQILFKTYYSENQQAPGFETRRIGSVIPVYPTTSVLTGTGPVDGTAASSGTAVTEFENAVARYHQEMDPHFGKNFRLSHPEDIRFGYWGDPAGLARIQTSLGTADEKSRRFLALGSATWKQVLSLSPAEPGLAPMRAFTTESGAKYVSAGGWSDLQPVLVLKAAGCSHVVYLTRTGGDSLFAQGVAKRLLNLDRDWSKLAQGSEEVKKLNREGDPQDQSSLWSQLFNLANPDSSYVRSLSAASAVLCTDWDSYSVKSQFVPLIEDSYRSSFWVNPNQSSPQIAALSPVLGEKKSGCSP